MLKQIAISRRVTAKNLRKKNSGKELREEEQNVRKMLWENGRNFILSFSYDRNIIEHRIRSIGIQRIAIASRNKTKAYYRHGLSLQLADIKP